MNTPLLKSWLAKPGLTWHVKFKENFSAACIVVWKYFFTNLVWINGNVGFQRRLESEKEIWKHIWKQSFCWQNVFDFATI